MIFLGDDHVKDIVGPSMCLEEDLNWGWALFVSRVCFD